MCRSCVESCVEVVCGFVMDVNNNMPAGSEVSGAVTKA